MKKKTRNIVVNNEEYIWDTGNFNGDGDHGIGLKVWKDKKIIFDHFYEADEYKHITPKYVSGVIKRIYGNIV